MAAPLNMSLLKALLLCSSAADYRPDSEVPLCMQEVVPKLERPLLIDPDNTIPRAIEVMFGSSPSRRYALVHSSFTPDAFYYNTWVSPPCLACYGPHDLQTPGVVYVTMALGGRYV